MASGELLHVAVQMLRAELVEGALVGAFQHRPQGFDAVGVHVTFDVLLQRVEVATVSWTLRGAVGAVALERVAP